VPDVDSTAQACEAAGPCRYPLAGVCLIVVESAEAVADLEATLAVITAAPQGSAIKAGGRQIHNPRARWRFILRLSNLVVTGKVSDTTTELCMDGDDGVGAVHFAGWILR
jgi:hypothetical protein